MLRVRYTLQLVLCIAAAVLLLHALDSQGWLDDKPAAVPVLERRACSDDEHFANGRPCILTFSHGKLTGISWYDTRRKRDNALRRRP